MSRPILDSQLQSLSEQVRAMWKLVDEAFAQGLASLIYRSAGMSKLSMVQKPKIEGMRIQIEQQAFHILTLQQPLHGRDLRFLTMVPAIATELDHIAEGGVGAAKLLLRIFALSDPIPNFVPETIGSSDALSRNQTWQLAAAESEEAAIAGLLEVGYEARHLLDATLKAFTACDAAAASSILQEDNLVDPLYKHVRDSLLTMLTKSYKKSDTQGDERVPQRITYMLWLAHRLARVADHCASICERTIFIVEGRSSVELRQAS